MFRGLETFLQPILSLPRVAKRIIVFSNDLCLCVLTVWLAYYLRLGEFVTISDKALFAAVGSMTIAMPIFVIFGLYRAIFRYTGWPALLTVARAILIYGLIYASIFTAIGVQGIPRTIGIIQPILLLLFLGASRLMARFWFGVEEKSQTNKGSRSKTLIYGAGKAGRQLAAAISNNNEMQVSGFLDDDERLHGHVLNGLPIYNPADLTALTETLSLSDVLLALPSVNRKRRQSIISQMRDAQVSVRTLPSVSDLAQGRVTISDIHDLDVDDLLGREPIEPDRHLLTKLITQKTIMVTGAGGSIGGELCRQILELKPDKLLMFEQSEFGLYNIQEQLVNKETSVTLIPLLGSVQDEDRLEKVMSAWKPHTVYHAAAYKHVPLVEHNLTEGVKNNVLGTLNTARAALSHSVENFVLISTDKAVRPTNIMGASKRLSEIILQALAAENESVNFSMVRFGNVLDSSGSVVPKFRQQIKNGGPVTITHPDITRYFMTIPEAAQLVIQAGAMAKGGDVFVLDMGEPVKIMELANRMIELSGLTIKNDENPEGDIAIEISGLRPGEKLYEELLIGGNAKPTLHSRIMKANEGYIPWKKLKVELSVLKTALNASDINTVQTMLSKVVAEYISSKDIVDWVYLNQLENS